MARPFIIAVDGVDYSGKTEIVNAIRDMVNDRVVKCFKFPSENHFGKLARAMIAENSREYKDLEKASSFLVSDFATTPLKFIMDHSEDEHRPVVIYDRYLSSVLGSQGPAAHHEVHTRRGELEATVPELFILLENTHEEALRRAQTRVKDNWDNRLEQSFMCNQEAFDKQSKAYRDGLKAVDIMFKEINCVRVDASRPLAEVIEEVRSYVLPLIAAGSNHYHSPREEFA